MLLVKSGYDQRADLPVRHRAPGLRVDHLDKEEIAPDPESVGAAILGRHHAGFGHAERVAHLRAPHAAELVALGERERFGRADHKSDRASGEVDAVVVRQVGEMQRIARHADQDVRTQLVDQLDLQRRGRRRTRPRHQRTHVGGFGGAGHHLTDRVDSEGERAMHPLAGLPAGARIDARKPVHRDLDVEAAARIEQRAAGGAARTPILRDRVARGRLQAEVAIELLVRHGAQHVLVEQRDLRPFARVVEAREIDVVELAAKERRAPGLAHGRDLALRLDRRNRRLAGGDGLARSCRHTGLALGSSRPIQRCCTR